MQEHEGAILLVDDNPDFVALARRALKKGDISNELVVAEDGVEALDYLFNTGPWTDKPHDNPIVILLDLKLPKVDGLEVLRRLRGEERTKHIPVVILIISLEEWDIIAGYGLGANSYVRKPVDFTQLAEVLRQAGLYWLVINQPPVEGG